MKYDVVALGELLIDFTIDGKSNQGNNTYEANPGGAPCNVLAMLNKMNKKTAFIGKVGNDAFGQILKKTIDDVGIDSKGLMFDEHVNTTLAFVNIDENGERSFSFYRNPGADMMLTEEEVDFEIIKNAKIFHFGTLSMTHEKVRMATKRAIDEAKKRNILISFDPNLRPLLWEDLNLAREQIDFGCSVCDILKIEAEEAKFLTNCDNIQEAVEILQNKYNIKIILLTAGSKGSTTYYKDLVVKQEAYLQSNTIDTTGAGDTFCGSCLGYIIENDIDNLNEEKIKDMISFASAAASIVTTKKGAICSMPEIEEVEKLRKKYE